MSSAPFGATCLSEGLPTTSPAPAGGGKTLELRIRHQPAYEPPMPWLAGIREFRAEVLYDRGRRPDFRDESGRYIDEQGLDFGSYHLTAHLGPEAEIAASVRLVPPESPGEFQAIDHLGRQGYAAMLTGLRAMGTPVHEAGRLVVSPRARGLGLGAWMVAAVMAAGRAVGAPLLIATSGTADGQHLLFERLGWYACPGTDRYSSHYEDTVRVIAHRVGEGAGEYEATASELSRHMDGAQLDGSVRIRGLGLPARG
ncbi:GNAT family N-acetyltransferase [Sphaerisporangium sp. NPDC049002]|uniref:GNAT family N-acetyltransferase n=1 Tax=unclassified Sphaerisporangium TaxID=2630420 RepID=UPI0033D6B06B